MNVSIPEAIQTRIIEHYGADKQLTVHMEECAELIQALSKILRNKDDKEAFNACIEHLTEEIADVLVCINQLQLIFDISDETLSDMIGYKVLRQMRRIEHDNK